MSQQFFTRGKESEQVAFARNNLASPSDDLVERLTSLQLCRLQDLHRVQSVVQRLAVDLPLFDSVWIDGLVQIGILTPFQGRLLQENHEQSLRIGPCVLVDVLSRNQTSSTYLARHRIRTERIDDSLGFSVPHHNSDRRWRKSQLSVLKVFQLRDENLDDVMDRLKDLIDHSREVVHPSIVLPNSIFSTAEGQPVVVSRYVSGLSLADLLVRRGRFPHELVLEIARQLIDALAKLEKCGMVHGDLRLATVRMTNRGQPILVETGIRQAVFPELTIHSSLRIEDCDGIAPERIGTGKRANGASDLYGMGCLLWQLLSGRPPYLVADPLMKLAAHQTERIEDVRVWAPDTPRILAESIVAMTSPSPEQRPRSFSELIQIWGRPNFRSRPRLKSYRRAFDGVVPHLAPSKASRFLEDRWSKLALPVLVFGVLAIAVSDRRFRGELLNLSNRITEVVSSRNEVGQTLVTHDQKNSTLGSNDRHTSHVDQSEVQISSIPFPPPNQAGEIHLDQAGPYRITEAIVGSTITISRSGPEIPIVIVEDTPLRIEARFVSLSGVRIRHQFSDRRTGSLSALIQIQCNRFRIENCHLESGHLANSPGDSASAVVWLPPNQPIFKVPPDLEPDRELQLDFINSTFTGDGTMLLMGQLPQKVRMNNCLKAGDGPCLAISRRAKVDSLEVELSNVTLRDSGPLLELSGEFANVDAGQTVSLRTNDCVFAIGPSSASLVELRTERKDPSMTRLVQMEPTLREGTGISVIRFGTPLVVSRNLKTGRSTVLDEADDQFNGLVACDFEFTGDTNNTEFSGESKNTVEGSALKSLSAPRSSQDQTLPGFNPELMVRDRIE